MLIIEYISPDGLVEDSFEMADGMTINQAAKTICPDTGGKFPVPTIAIAGAKPAVRNLGDWDFPLSNARIQFRQLAMGGGGGESNPLQIVLQVAIIALAAAATWYLGGTGGFLMGTLGWGEFAATLGAGLAGAGIMMLGTMLQGALFQNQARLPQGQLGATNAEQASPTYNINASGNQARLFQTEPELFGRMKIVPDFVANTWTEYIDNDQIGYFVYGIGRGYYDVESLQFGETVFWKNGVLLADTGYEIQRLQIVEPGDHVTIFPDNVVTSDEVSGQTIFAPNEDEYDGVIGPYTTNPPGTRINRILLDFVFQQGIGHYHEQGWIEEFTIEWKIEYRQIDDQDNAVSAWSILDEPSIRMATSTPQRITKSYDVQEGRYQVRVSRTNDKGWDGRSLDTLTWAAMRAMLPGTYTYPITCIAFSVKANNALTQAASRQFAAIATRKLPVYNRATKSWSAPEATRSWAAAISHVCKCEWGGRLTDADFDLDTLWAIDESLKAKNWYYDSYIDGPYLVWSLLCEMCQSQCVIPRFVGPVLSFVQDLPNRAPSFALTPRNIMRSSFSVNYVTWSDSTPDDVTVDYLDAEYGFQQRDVTAILPESESQEPSSLTILGITDRKHAHGVAVAYAAHNRWQRIKVECQVEALGRLINVGDICTVAHPRFRNTCAGAVKSWDESRLIVCIKLDMPFPDDKTKGFYIEDPLQSEYPKTLTKFQTYGVNTNKPNVIDIMDTRYLLTDSDVNPKSRLTIIEDEQYVAFSRQDGSIWGPCRITKIDDGHIYLDQSDYATLLLQGQGNPFEFFTWGKDCQPTTWTLYEAKQYQRLMIVNSIKSQDAIHYTLELLNYTNNIYQYDNLPVPVWGGRGQLPSDAKIQSPSVLNGTVNSRTSITLSWLSVLGATWYEAEVSSDGTNWNNLGRTSETQITTNVNAGPIYARVRAGNDIKTSSWATWSGNTTITTPAVPVPSLQGAYDGSGKIVWNAVPGATKYTISLSSGSNRFYTSTQTGTEFQITPEIQTGGPYRDLTFTVSASNDNGTSGVGTVNLSCPAPVKITGGNFVPTEAMLTINSVTPTLTGITGYAFARGNIPNFSVNQVSAFSQTDSLPYTWYNLQQGTMYFRIAAKDAFYDSYHDYTGLNWSDVFTKEIP